MTLASEAATVFRNFNIDGDSTSGPYVPKKAEIRALFTNAENSLSAYVDALAGTSATSLAIETGTKVFTTQPGKQWSLGQRLRAASDDGTRIMEGEITGYTGTTLTIDVDYVVGSGSHADWNINIAGHPGADAVTYDFNNVAAVEATNIPAPIQFFRIAGYSTPGDGGGALYKGVGAEPSHAGKIQSNDGAWWELAEDVISVKMLGATGSGSGDDAAAINNALAIGRDVKFPKGNYRITSQVTLVDKQSLRIFGEAGAKITRAGNAATLVLDSDCEGNTIFGIEFDGQKGIFPAALSGVVVFGPKNTVFGCHVHDYPGHGIIFSNTFVDAVRSKALFNIVEDCDFIGITFPDAHYSEAFQNYVEGCGYEGITIDSGAGVGADYCTIDGNTVIDCVGGVGGIGVEGSVGSRIANNYVKGCVGGVVFQNNINPSSHCTVIGNVCEDNTGPGIWLKETSGNDTNRCTIAGNICRNNTTYELVIDSGCEQNVVSGNDWNGGNISILGANNHVEDPRFRKVLYTGETVVDYPVNGALWGMSTSNLNTGSSATVGYRATSDAGTLALIKHNAGIGGASILQNAGGASMFYDALDASGQHVFRSGTSPSTKFLIGPNYLQIGAITNYADDAAAASGGVPIGGVYRNSNNLRIRIA